MEADSGSSSQPPAKISEKEAIVNAAATESSDEVTTGEDTLKTADAEAPKNSTRMEVPAETDNVEHPAISSSIKTHEIVPCPPDANPRDSLPSMFSSSGLSSWAKNLKFPQQDSKAVNSGMSAFSRFTSGLSLNFPAKGSDEFSDTKSPNTQVGGALESFTKGVVDSSRSAVKAMQVKARHIVSQNKRRYQEGEFDLDMTYITENIIAMGFPAGDLSSGLFGFFEGLYRNHMEEVIKFFETHHKGKYKVYNLCSERLYDASRFEGKVASFPFDDHNCPPIQLIPSFCQSAYSWLKEDIQNVVVVHCKAGMARTGLMICCLLLFLKFFPTAEEAIDYYNQKRCVDGKALVLPSQIRYVKYYERVLTYYNGEIPRGRRCMLRGFRLINCPYWIRPAITIYSHSGILFSTRKHPKTKDLMPEDFWIKAPRKGVVVFALPGEPGLTELAGDFKIHFHESQGDFYCWLNTTMTENRRMLTGGDLDGFEKRNLPAPGFQVEIVMVELDGNLPSKPKSASSTTKEPQSGSGHNQTLNAANSAKTQNEDNDNVFSDSDDGEQSKISNPRKPQGKSGGHVSTSTDKKIGDLTRETNNLSINDTPKPDNSSNKSNASADIPVLDSVGASDFKAIAADASVFSFGDEEDYESD